MFLIVAIVATVCLILGIGVGYVARNRAYCTSSPDKVFKHLTEEVQDMIFRYDVVRGEFDFITKAAVGVTGYRVEELQKYPVLLYRMLVPSEEFNPKNLDEMLIEGAKKNPVIRIQRKDGEQAWVKIRSSLIRDKAGRVLSVVGSLSDVTQESRARKKLEDSEETYRVFFSASNLAAVMMDDQGCIRTANEAFLTFAGVDQTSLEKCSEFSQFLDEESGEKFNRYVALAMERPDIVPRGFSAIFQDENGIVKPVYIVLSPLPEKKSSVVTVLDLPELHVAKEAMDIQKHYFTQLFQNSPLGIAFLDKEGRVLDINPGYESIFGYEPNEIRKWQIRHFLVPRQLMDEGEAIYNTVLAGKTVQKETVRKTKDGRDIPVMVYTYPLYLDDEVGGMFNIYQDISERKEYEQQLAHRNFHDRLTDLPNRLLFIEHVEQAIKQNRKNPSGVNAVLMVDIDRFRRINETYGHLIGDGIIKEIGQRLTQVLSPSDSLARLMGDQFGIMIPGVDSKNEVMAKAGEIVSTLKKSFEVNGDDLQVNCNIGLVFNFQRYDKPGDVLRDAEIALQQSKSGSEGGSIKIFKEGMHKKVAEALSVENELRKAVRQDQFEVYYQPILSLADERIVGFEALLRWFHPSLGCISPERFIPVAEYTGLIVELGKNVLRTACAQLMEWNSQLPESNGLIMSVNVSPKQLYDHNIAAIIDKVLAETHMAPSHLKLEITESLIMKDTRAAIKFFEALRSRGVRLAVDDFGTGYSSLGYLHRFPVDYLKIDKSFVSGDASDKEGRTIIKSVVDLANNLGFKVIAEGAETREQVEMLKKLGCHEVQGFYFAEPMKATEAFAYLEVQNKKGIMGRDTI